MEVRLNNIEEQNLKGSLKLVRTLTLKIFSGLSLRFQVAGYLLFIAGEVASSNGRPPPPPPKRFLKCNFYHFSKGITAPKKPSSPGADSYN